MQPFPTEPAETYAITVDANNEAAERWYWQADEADLTRTLASARDLARVNRADALDFDVLSADASDDAITAAVAARITLA